MVRILPPRIEFKILLDAHQPRVVMSSTKKDLVQISSYSRRLKENVRSILDNYGEILRASKV